MCYNGAEHRQQRQREAAGREEKQKTREAILEDLFWTRYLGARHSNQDPLANQIARVDSRDLKNLNI